MKIYQKSLIALFLSAIFVVTAFSQDKEEKTVKFKVVKEEDGEKTVFDTTLTVTSLDELKDMESLHEMLGEDAFKDIDMELDDLEKDIKVRIMKHGGDGEDSDANIFIFKDGDELMSEKIEIIIDGLEMDLDSLEEHMDNMKNTMFYEYEIESEEEADGKIRKTIIMSTDGDKSGHNVLFFSDDDDDHDHMEIEVEVEEGENGKKIIIKDEDGTTKEYLIEGGEGTYFIDEDGKIESMGEGVLWHDKSDRAHHIVVDIDEDSEGNKVIIKKSISVDKEVKDGEKKIIIWHDDDGDGSEKEHEVHVNVIKKGGDSEKHTVEHSIRISLPDADDYALMGKAGVNAAPSDEQKLNIGRLKIHPAEGEKTYTFSFNADKGNKTEVYFLDDEGEVIFKEKLSDFKGTFKKEIDLKENAGKSIFLIVSQGDKFNAHKIRIK